MKKLKPATRLQRISELDLHLSTDSNITLTVAGKRFNSGLHTLAILDTFRLPLAFDQGVERLHVAGVADWIALTSAIQRLFELGVLQDVDAQHASPKVGAGYGNPHIHIAMLNDRMRTTQYLKAIREVVRPGDVVVDIGTGTGVLSIAAAQAGAAHVYAIEANPTIARVAQAAFACNGLEDRITLIGGRSTQIDLPEKADVLISEMIGNDPLGEDILGITADAVQRLLKPNARLVPERLEIIGLPVIIPASRRVNYVVSPETLANWESWYDLNLSPLADMRRPVNQQLFSIRPQIARDWVRLSAPLQLADVDLRQRYPVGVDNIQTTIAHTTGTINGLLITFDAILSPQTRLSTHPDVAGDDNHWASPVWGIFPSCEVQEGDALTVQYQYGQGVGTQVQLWAGANNG